MSDALIEKISQNLIECQPEETVESTREALENELNPLDIINQGLMPGMDVIGEKFQTGEYFLPQMVIAARAMQEALKVLEPELKNRQESVESRGTLVIGTVEGDIHEIGKSLVASLMSANGFTVHDVGIDVSPELFIEKVKETKATLLGLSALLTTTMTAQRKVIKALEEAGIRDQVKVMVGGAPVTEEWADSIGADGYADDVMGAILLSKQLVS